VDEIADQVVEKIKAVLPAAMPTSPAVAAPDPARDQAFVTQMFAPGVPLRPVALDPRDPQTGIIDPRRSEFAATVNMQVNSSRGLVPFTMLRDVADKVEVIRRCIEVRKAQILGYDWDITVDPAATLQVMRDQGISAPGAAAKVVREQLEPEIVRLREWWSKPDRLNGLDFTTWLGMLLEEQLVVDALSIWPRRTLGGETVGFEILDGATIKPLLDFRGNRPAAPAPAFQQVLYGFPRGEFTADADDDEVTNLTAGQLVYRPRHRRSWTPYGNPEVEQALAAADIYLKRQAWIRSEFIDGRTPDQVWKVPETSKFTPSQLLEYEQAINAEYADPRLRRAIRLTPPGVEPDQLRNFAELYKPELDEYLIKLICSCFDVMPTEIGFPPSSGIGGKGHQEGEANSAWRKATRPTCRWAESICTDLSRQFLRMPAGLRFTLLGYQIEDQVDAETVANSQIRRAGLTVNEDRGMRGMPLLEFPEADEVMMMTPSGMVFLRGAMEGPTTDSVPAPGEAPVEPHATPVSAVADAPVPEDGAPIADNAPVPDGFVRVAGHLRAKPSKGGDEAAKFLKFATARQGRSWRDFTFEQLPATLGDELNRLGRLGDLDAAKALVGDLGKARARRVSRATKATLTARHGRALQSSVANLFPSAADLVDGWIARDNATKSAGTSAARAFVAEQIDIEDDDVFDDVDDDLGDMLADGHNAAFGAATGSDWDDEDDDDDSPDRSRLSSLLDSVPGLRTALIGGATAAIAGALLSDDPQAAVQAALDDTDRYETFASVQLTTAYTAGTLDGADAAGSRYVQLVASADECDFCAGYDGRIMAVDDTDGMPPLHNGCQCDIEPLT
jgi:hypothetical protein